MSRPAEWCRFCGLDGYGGAWPSPVICPDCFVERGDEPADWDSWRARAACALAGLEGWWPDAGRILDLRWACEVPPARNRRRRWDHVDLEDLRRRALRWRPHARGWMMTDQRSKASL